MFNFIKRVEFFSLVEVLYYFLHIHEIVKYASFLNNDCLVNGDQLVELWGQPVCH
jgi:hypothetical protein